jgi:hypothetical protein
MEMMMTTDLIDGAARRPNPWRIAGWTIAALLLVTPFVAMQLTEEVNWSAGDFIVAGLLIGAVGVTLELTVRSSRNPAYRAGVGLALLASFLLVWVNGAVGMIGNEDNPYNLLFFVAIAVALAGAVIVAFRAAGMALAMAGAALVQGAVATFGMAADPRGGVLSLVMAGLWLLSAALFRHAAR